MDYVLETERPPKPADGSTDKEAKEYYESWEKNNRLTLLLIKTRIARSIRGAIPKCETAKEYLEAVDKQFKPTDKQMGGTIMSELCAMRLTGIGGTRQHIMKMRDLSSQLKSFDMEPTEQFLVQLILNSLPPQFDAFKVSYNTHREKWSVDELLSMCVQEETRLLMSGKGAPKEAHLGESSNRGGSKKGNKDDKKKRKRRIPPATALNKKDAKCFFCKKKGHMKNECSKRKAWLERKGLLNKQATTSE
ncbi:uncharacterized protein LOC114759168 [Neltuma alba]|nr:uncharacterized protein LOC114718873 [Prosopis alba]XP_028794314.1 uncharacterized protein LOC114749934 [Prosopis alba]XP_028804103.1 uncharacterized protein LOC114759168 [Prosopis alba]